MTGKTHRIIGIAAGVGTYLANTQPEYGPATFAAVIAMSSIGSLLPDLDNASAQIWQSVPLGRVAGELVDPFVAHRNFSHSILGVLLFGYGFDRLLNMTPEYWSLNHQAILSAFLIGYSSHIVADMVTIQGVPLAWPLKRKFGIPPYPFEGARIITGKWFENLVVFPLVNLILIMLIARYWQEIKSILLR